MRKDHRALVSRHAIWAACALGAALFLNLSACSSSGSKTSAAAGVRNDIVTASDEPEGRKRARIRLELAVGYFEKGQTTVALDELKLALTADPNFAQAHNMKGLIYMRLNEPNLAEDSFRRALALDGQDAGTMHNLGWMYCQQGRFTESAQSFNQALANPQYTDRAKTWMTQGLCQMKAGQLMDAESSLSRAYELDPSNPVSAYNLASLLFKRGEFKRAQFYVRQVNNGELANSESLWLGAQTERRLNNSEGTQQLGSQLKKRFPQSREAALFDRGAFND